MDEFVDSMTGKSKHEPRPWLAQNLTVEGDDVAREMTKQIDIVVDHRKGTAAPFPRQQRETNDAGGTR